MTEVSRNLFLSWQLTIKEEKSTENSRSPNKSDNFKMLFSFSMHYRSSLIQQIISNSAVNQVGINITKDFSWRFMAFLVTRHGPWIHEKIYV